MAESRVQQLRVSEEWQWAIEKWQAGTVQLLNWCTATEIRKGHQQDEKTKWMLRRTVRVSNTHLSELIYSSCNHRITGPDQRETTGICT